VGAPGGCGVPKWTPVAQRKFLILFAFQGWSLLCTVQSGRSGTIHSTGLKVMPLGAALSATAACVTGARFVLERLR